LTRFNSSCGKVRRARQTWEPSDQTTWRLPRREQHFPRSYRR